MRDNGSEAEMLREAFGPGKGCPSEQELERLLDGGADSKWERHLASCPYCQAEVRLLGAFASCEPRPEEAAVVERITYRLRERAREIWPAREARRKPWWRGFFSIPRLAPVALALAAVVMMVGVTLQWRRSAPPVLRPLSDSGPEVLRSNTVALIAPVGDLQRAPSEIQWQPALGASKYEVRLLEVDRTELWKAATTQTRIELPSQVQAGIVPAKTMLVQVSALDPSARIVAQSELVRFRVSLKPRDLR